MRPGAPAWQPTRLSVPTWVVEPGTQHGRIVLTEDDPITRRTLSRALERAGYTVIPAADGPSGLRAATGDGVDLMVLDLQLPLLDGLGVLRRLRAVSDLPVIIVSGHREEDVVVTGFALGADDFVAKPILMPELLGRIQAVLRRSRPAEADGVVTTTVSYRDGLEIDRAAETVHVDGTEVELTPKEFSLLVALAERSGRVTDVHHLLATVWGTSSEFMSPDTVVEHVRRLRRKIDNRKGVPPYVVTRRGSGYRFDG